MGWGSLVQGVHTLKAAAPVPRADPPVQLPIPDCSPGTKKSFVQRANVA